MCADFDAHREQAVLLQFVELGPAEPGSIDDFGSRSRRVDGMQCPWEFNEEAILELRSGNSNELDEGNPIKVSDCLSRYYG